MRKRWTWSRRIQGKGKADRLEHKIISQLKEIAGKDGVLTAKEDLNAYSYDSQK